jgi:hypothetical protein
MPQPREQPQADLDKGDTTAAWYTPTLTPTRDTHTSCPQCPKYARLKQPTPETGGQNASKITPLWHQLLPLTQQYPHGPGQHSKTDRRGPGSWCWVRVRRAAKAKARRARDINAVLGLSVERTLHWQQNPSLATLANAPHYCKGE